MYTDLFETVWGRPPSQLVARGFEPTSRDLERLLERWNQGPPTTDPKRSGEIWPLISHHETSTNLFGVRSGPGTVQARALHLLFAFDGLVVADPVADLDVMVRRGEMPRAVAAINGVIAEAAQLEPLLRAGLVRITPLRPSLDSADRSNVLSALGLDPELTVFQNFGSAAAAADNPALFEHEYLPQVNELFERFGLPHPGVVDSADAWEHVRRLAAAVIEVSWQVAVCAGDPQPDVALAGKWENHLFSELVSMLPPSVAASQARAWHFSMMSAGLFPRIDSSQLTVPDAIAVRRDDSFARFRDGLSQALAAYNSAISNGQTSARAQAAFETEMRHCARSLADHAGRASFSRVVTAGSIGLGVAMAAEWLIEPGGQNAALLSPVAGALSAVFAKWLQGRPRSREVAGRYCVAMGGGI